MSIINLLIYIFIGMLISLLLCNYLNPQNIEGYTSPPPKLKRCINPAFPHLSGSVNGDFCYSDTALRSMRAGEELKCPSNNCISPTELVLKYKCVNNICKISDDSNGVSLEECKKVCEPQDTPENFNMGTFKCVDGGCSLVPDNTGFVTKGECDAFCEDPDKAEMVSADDSGINIMITNTKGGKSRNRGAGDRSGGNGGEVEVSRNGGGNKMVWGDRDLSDSYDHAPLDGDGREIELSYPNFGKDDQSVKESIGNEPIGYSLPGYETMIQSWGGGGL